MALVSELKIDHDRCQHCGRGLYQHVGGKRAREVLREYDGSMCIAIIFDVTCTVCGGVTSVDYMADLLPAPAQRPSFAAVPTV